MTEVTHSFRAAQSQEQQTGYIHPMLSQVALHGAAVAAVHFYGADEHLIGRVPSGEHRLIVETSPSGGRRSVREAVGSGRDVDEALHDSLRQMRALETVHTKPIVRVEMTETASVDFTAFAHYGPKVAPGAPVHQIPSYLTDMLHDDDADRYTYDNTVTREGWQTEIRSILDGYVTTDAAGQDLVRQLKIRSLDHLTPEQAVKLSAAFVQNISRYSFDADGKPDGKREDRLTTPELLREGIFRQDDPEWHGNGVCRNIASNVKAVFESLKATQGELSMLGNTYAVYGVGYNGAGYDANREDNVTSLNGHAWNTFVTVDASGSASATIIDATWALGASNENSLEHLDRTDIRAAAQIVELFKLSDRKKEAFPILGDYFMSLADPTRAARDMPTEKRLRTGEFATTEYLKAAALLPNIPNGTRVPGMVWGARLRPRLMI